MVDLRRLGDRIDVIETALSVTLQEPEPEHRGRLLEALDSATAAVRAEHQDESEAQEKRSMLHLIRGHGPQPDPRPQRLPPASAASAEHWTGRIPDRAARSAG